MKKGFLYGWCAVLVWSGVATAQAAFTEAQRQALQLAMDAAQESLSVAGIPQENISLLPIGNDEDRYVEGLLKNVVTDAGLSYVEHGSDPLWDAILAEIEWDDRKKDMLDPTTLVKFGQLKGTQMLMYGTVREVRETTDRVFAEVELHLTSVTTKQHVWGGVFARRFYLPGRVEGIVDLDPAVRAVLQDAFAGAADSIRDSSKLQAIKTVVFVPLAGDVDGYVKSLTENMLAETPLNPMEMDVMSLAQARMMLRDKPGVADAVLFGAVRDLSRELKHDEPLKKTYEIHAEVQLTLQASPSGEVLWSRTLRAEGLDEEVITGQEAAWNVWKTNPGIVMIIAGVVVGLMILGMFFKAVSRPR